MHKVLIIESDQTVLAIHQKGLAKYSSQFESIFVSDAEDSIRDLAKESISVLVTDLVMPNVGGLDLLAYMDRYHPTIQCIVLTPPGINDFEGITNKSDSLHYLEKTVDYNKLAWTILEAIDSLDESGSIAKLSVSSLLQLVEIEDKTCHLKIKHNKKEQGSFYVVRGMLLDAECGNIEGEEAALIMIGWEHVDFKFDKLPQNEITQKIDKELMYLLMEGKRRKDEMDEMGEGPTPSEGSVGESVDDDFDESVEDRLDGFLYDNFQEDADEEGSGQTVADLQDETEEKIQSMFDDDDLEEIVKDQTDSKTDIQNTKEEKNQSLFEDGFLEELEKNRHDPAVDLQQDKTEEKIRNLNDEDVIEVPEEIHQESVIENSSVADEEERQISNGILLVEGHHSQAARKELVSFLKKWPQSFKGWLWYSRVSSSMKAIESALKNAAIFAPGEAEVNADIKKLVLAKNTVRTESIRHCPFCWSPVEETFSMCQYCKSHLYIHEKFFSSQRPAKQELIEEAIIRYTNVLNREKNATANYHLGMAYINLEQWEQGLEQFMMACQAVAGNQFFTQQQKKLMNFMASIETMPQHEVYTRNPEINRAKATAEDSRQKEILVVEDSTVTRKVISMALSQTGYNVTETKNGAEALAYIEDKQPDLILLDIIMPGMDGYQVLTAMKQKKWMKDVPVIMLTARGKLIDKLKGKMAGSTEYLTKPFEPEELIKTIGKYL